MRFLKIVTKALFGLHLWLPIAYSLGFLAIVAISGLIVGSWPYYFIGLSLSLGVSLGLVYYSAVRAKRKPTNDQPEAAAPQPAPQPMRQQSVQPDYESVEDTAARIRDEQLRYAQVMKANPSGNVSGAKYADIQPPVQAPKAESFMRPEVMQQYYGDATRPELTPQTAHDALYSSYAPPQAGDQPPSSQFSPYVQPSNVASAGSPKLDEYESRRPHSGEPRIYRTRKEPNVIIYEYDDCYEKFYLNPDGSQTFLCTETKPKK